MNTANVSFERFHEYEAEMKDRFVKVEGVANDAKETADKAKAEAHVAALAVAEKADDNRVKVLIGEEEKRRFLSGHGGVITVLLAVLAVAGVLFNEVHSLSDRTDRGFETMNARFDKIAPPTVSLPPAVLIVPQKP